METAVKRIGAVVVAELRACGYMESTIGQYEKTIRALTGFIDSHGGAYTPALGAAFASMTVSPRTGRFSAQRQFGYRRLAGVFDAYLRTGHVDLSQRKRGGGGDRDCPAEDTQPVTLPLPGLLAARLADYVLNERPDSGDGHVFLRSVAPHTRLADHASIYRVTAETFRKAGVANIKAGTRLLRHSAASRLLRAAVPVPTISEVLGHASPESTNTYLSVDVDRLLECVLPVPQGARS